MLSPLMARTIEDDRRREADRHIRVRLIDQARACCQAAGRSLRQRLVARFERRTASS